MKKIWLTVAGSMLIAISATYAQERSDTTRTQSSDYRNTETQTPDADQESSTLYSQDEQPSTDWRTEDLESVSREDLPDALQQTLSSPDFEGWEDATVYRNRSTGAYMVVMDNNGTPAILHFDRDGKQIMQSNRGSGVPDQSAYGDQQSMGTTSETTSESLGTNTPETSTGDTQSSQYGTEPSSSGTQYGTQDQTTPQQERENKKRRSGSRTSGSTPESSSAAGTTGTTSSGTSGSGSTTTGSTYGVQDGTSTSDVTGSGATGTSGYSGTAGTTGTGPGSNSTSGNTAGTTTPSGSSTISQTGDQDRDDNATRSSSSQAWQSTDQDKDQSTQWKAEDRVLVTVDDIPTSLRMTLEDDQYEGWENSSLYRNRKTNEYMIEIRDGSSTKTYYFDKDGKAKKSDNEDQK